MIIGDKSYIIWSVFWIFSNKKENDETNEELEDQNKLLCRFVMDGIGRKVGESVAIDDDLLIIKKGKKYLGVPLKHIEKDKKTLLVKGLVNDANAEKMGEKWREESFKKISPNVEDE